MTATVQFNMRIEPTLKQRLDEVALLDRRSTASLIAVVIGAWLEGREYRPSFDMQKIAAHPRAAELRPPPGRPRSSKRPRAYTANHIAPARAFVEGRDRVTIDEIIAGVFADAPSSVAHALPAILREVMVELGWVERVDQQGNRVWISLSD